MPDLKPAISSAPPFAAIPTSGTARRGHLFSMLRPALVLFIFMTVLTGLVYPLVVTGIARVLFPWQAGGSLINRNGQHAMANTQAVGSALIGQYFDQPWYFWPRPSATAPMPYNAAASGGSNTGPTNPVLIKHVKARVAALRATDPGNKRPIPVDLVTSSASGLDPEESLAAAYYQIPRIARLRHISPAKLTALVNRYVVGRSLAILGETAVNVLKLNLALDRQYPH